MRIRQENALLLVIDFQERLMPAISKEEALVKKTAQLMKGCTLLQVPVIVTQQYTKGLGETVAPLREMIEAPVIEKTVFSCFGGEGFRERLEQSGKKDILVTGVETHICVLQTVFDLLEHGYRVFLAADCLGTRKEIDHQYAMKRMERAGAGYTTAESVLFEFLQDARHPKRKEISALIK